MRHKCERGDIIQKDRVEVKRERDDVGSGSDVEYEGEASRGGVIE